MAIDQHQPPVRELPGNERIGVTYLGEKALEGTGLLLGMTTPVLGVGDKLGRLDAAQLPYSITNLFNHRSSPLQLSPRHHLDGSGGLPLQLGHPFGDVASGFVARILGLNFDSSADQRREKQSSDGREARGKSLKVWTLIDGKGQYFRA